MSIDVPHAIDLAAEFLRWEVATAIAGLLLGVNPFDEPNVKQAKDATQALLDAYAARRPAAVPRAARHGRRHPSDPQRRRRISRRPGGRGPRSARRAPAITWRSWPTCRRRTPTWAQALERRARRAWRRRPVSPRPPATAPLSALHGTAAQGRAQHRALRRDDREPAPICRCPGEPFSFGSCEAAQALGDFQSLDAGRPARGLRAPAAERSGGAGGRSSPHSHRPAR